MFSTRSLHCGYSKVNNFLVFPSPLESVVVFSSQLLGNGSFPNSLLWLALCIFTLCICHLVFHYLFIETTTQLSRAPSLNGFLFCWYLGPQVRVMPIAPNNDLFLLCSNSTSFFVWDPFPWLTVHHLLSGSWRNGRDHYVVSLLSGITVLHCLLSNIYKSYLICFVHLEGYYKAIFSFVDKAKLTKYIFACFLCSLTNHFRTLKRYLGDSAIPVKNEDL